MTKELGRGNFFLTHLQLFHYNKRRVDMDIIKLPRKNNPLLQNSVNIMLLLQTGRANMRE